MKHWPQLPRVEGLAPRQAHADLPDSTYEREFGAEGFFGPATHLVHAHPPTGWTDIEGPLRPRAFDLVKLAAAADCPLAATPVLHNDALALRLWRFQGSMDHLVRNADGDELLFIHQGGGQLFCDFGRLAFSEGDYIVLPRGTQWRIETSSAVCMLLLEATGEHYFLPERGIVGQHAFFDPALLTVPALDDAYRAQQGPGDWRVIIKRRGQLSTVRYPYNPLDTLGWQGNHLPMRINWRDLRPLMSHRYHLPPSAHTTFVSERFVVCTFCPRPLETDPGALKVPFFHSNNDYDEVLFYHRGEFFSRDNIHPGMLSLHPSGFPHGPHPKAFAAAAQGSSGAGTPKTETDEVAVMIDARDALQVGDGLSAVEWEGYVHSWREDR